MPVSQPLAAPGQYTSLLFIEHLALEGIAASVGSVGDADDKALLESVLGLRKTECLTMASVEWWNNRSSTAASATPAVQAEAEHYRALTATRTAARDVLRTAARDASAEASQDRSQPNRTQGSRGAPRRA